MMPRERDVGCVEASRQICALEADGAYLKSPCGVSFRSFADAWKGAETAEAFFVQTYEGVRIRKTLCHNPRKKESVQRNEL